MGIKLSALVPVAFLASVAVACGGDDDEDRGTPREARHSRHGPGHRVRACGEVFVEGEDYERFERGVALAIVKAGVVTGVPTAIR